jgi:hypothetical protein
MNGRAAATLTIAFCQSNELPLEQALTLKLAYNKTRPYRHGGKVA